MVLAGCPAYAALTPDEVATALGNVQGVEWTIAGPDDEAWSVTSAPALQVTSPVTDSAHTLRAMVTGPGVIELRADWSNSSAYTGILRMDGGYFSNFVRQTPMRIPVEAGSHVVGWTVTRSNYPSGNQSATFRGAKWEPYQVQPLQSGAVGSGVALSSVSWIGQDAWHSGDGAAAWVSERGYGGTLRGTFVGGGVLSYQVMPRGSFSVAMDNQNIHTTAPTNIWSRKMIPVGTGSHTVIWTAYGEMAVDEVELIPEVPLAVALDTPTWSWSTMAGLGTRAFGVSTDGANGGASVMVPRNSTLSSAMEAGGILKLRYRGGTPRVTLNNVQLNGAILANDPENAGTSWMSFSVAVVAAGGNLSISTDGETEIDSVSLIPYPGSVAEVLDVDGNILNLSGNWGIEADAVSGGFHAVATVSSASPEASMDFMVTGPSRISVGYTKQNEGMLRLLLDGRELWNSAVPTPTGMVTIEVPAGEHVVSGLVRVNPGSATTSKAVVTAVTIEPAPGAGEISAALGFPGSWAFHGAWKKTARDGGKDVLVPDVPVGTADGAEVSHFIGTSVTGPGFFWFSTDLPAGSDVSGSYFSDHMIVAYPESWSVEGWYRQAKWVPPGEHHIQLRLKGPASGMKNVAIDAVEFVPSELTSLAAATGQPGLSWENDDVSPWVGVVRQPEARDAAVSPVLEAGGESIVSTQVVGPGALTFTWRRQGRNAVRGEVRVNGELSSFTLGDYSGEAIRMLEIPAGPATIEWKAIHQGHGSWLELENVGWTPWPETPLAVALDAHQGVTWTTSSPIGFTGRPDAGAAGGTAAYVRLQPGETAWLEATVDGPGIFDFWLRHSEGSEVRWQDATWTLTLDDVPVLSNQQWWDPVWIKGAGPHRLRLTFTNNRTLPMSGFVDDVTWIPIRQHGLDASWSSGLPDAEVFSVDGGRNGDSAVVIRQSEAEAWVEKTVTGPCLVEWDSKVVNGYGSAEITVNGQCRLWTDSSPTWTKNTLSLPDGEHVIRWSNGQFGDQPVPATGYSFAGYQLISGLSVTPGISPIAEALDHTGGGWLMIGEDAGELVSGVEAEDGVDALKIGLRHSFYYLNLGSSAQRVSGAIRLTNSAGWIFRNSVVAAGETAYWSWTYDWSDDNQEIFIDRFSAESLTETDLAAALDWDREVVTTQWRGLVSPDESHDGSDVAWSFLESPYHYRPENEGVLLAGPGRIKFHWRQEGSGTLRLKLDGEILPLPAAGIGWTEVEFEVSDGSHRVEWVHDPTDQTSDITPSQAWVDQVSFVPTESFSLGEATGGTIPSLASADEDEMPAWKPVSYRNEEGEWVAGARAIRGAPLKATVNGPVMLRFSGRASDGIDLGLQATGGGGIGKSIVITFPGSSEEVFGHFLVVKVDGVERVKIPAVAGGWTNASLFIPAGAHEVEWRLVTWRSVFIGGRVLTPTVSPGMQAWVTDIRFQTAASHYQEWSQALPADKADPADDADGDGASNFFEYALGSEAGNADSKPQSVLAKMAVNRSGENRFQLHLPYLSPNVSGVIESSTDLVVWAPENGITLLSHKPEQPSWFLESYFSYNDTHHVLEFDPESLEADGKFYRLRLDAPEPE